VGTRRAVRTDDGAVLTLVLDGADPRSADVTVVLSHGWTLTHHSFDEVVDRLLAEHPGTAVVRWDHRDHGRSTSSRAGLAPTVRRLGDDLATVLAATRPGGALVVGGHSMGAMTVMAWARDRPEDVARVHGFVLVSGAASLELRPSRAMRLAGRLPHRVRIPRLPAGMRRSHAWARDADPALVAASGRRDGWVRLRAVGGWYGALLEHDELEALELMATRHLVVLVGDQDRLTPAALSERIVGAAPGARLEVVRDTGHMLPLERPDVLVGVLGRLVEEAGR
jgi:pimeloyl-ACP methyl ester carboxylesterase